MIALPKNGAMSIRSTLDARNKAHLPWRGSNSLTGLSYTSSANHKENIDADGTVVSFHATQQVLRELPVPLRDAAGELSVECTNGRSIRATPRRDQSTR